MPPKRRRYPRSISDILNVDFANSLLTNAMREKMAIKLCETTKRVGRYLQPNLSERTVLSHITKYR